jgi:hypothetical protein
MANPVDSHYAALWDIAQYIYQTCIHGIYYWQDSPLLLLDEGPLPTASPEPYVFTINPTKHDSLHAYVD